MNDIKSVEILQNSQPIHTANKLRSTAHEEAVRLDVTQAHFSFGSHAVLRGVDLKLRAGEVFGLLGP